MKKILLICLIALTSINADEYLISTDGLSKSGGYGGFAYQAMKVNGKTTALAGGGGNWVINDKYHIGASGYSAKRKYIKKDVFSYGAINLGWSADTSTPYSPYAFLSLGYGNVGDGLTKENTEQNSRLPDAKSTTDNQFFSIGLNVGVQLKITKWFRLVPFVGYTYISLENNDYYANSDFGGLNYGVQFNFGSWRK